MAESPYEAHQWADRASNQTGIFWCATCGIVTNTKNTNVPCLPTPNDQEVPRG